MTELSAKLAAALPGNTGVQPQWLKSLRETGAEQFREIGLPTRKSEAWKYTGLGKLELADLKLVSGFTMPFSGESHPLPLVESALQVKLLNGKLLAQSGELPAGLTVMSMDDALATGFDGLRVLLESLVETQTKGASGNGFSALNSATLESGVLDDDSVLNRLAELRNGGMTIGLSTSGPKQADVIRKAMAIERDGIGLFGTIQSTWNLLEQSAGNALAEAHGAGKGILIKESMANGRLTVREPATSSALVKAVPGFPADAIAIAAALAQPWVDAVISGASTVEQLRSNLRALDIDAADVPDLSALVETPEVYWAKRSSLAWT